ncbi:hypothetical protein CROQUDRAFT_654835 [Cronartium quercuum f. sp. fusiforme G11]|uniref:Uncharacterized protein n=1 Tax=Cronartium quercuum f. sp. fusiforme G11 TaxID=708437 RepID=A0A9P6NQR5_9BASI|nr:hypothetical protein CROQUDRAFT_654835 [Cronartium quercuum f. sp. fusiforme G11]
MAIVKRWKGLYLQLLTISTVRHQPLSPSSFSFAHQHEVLQASLANLNLPVPGRFMRANMLYPLLTSSRLSS